MSGTTLLPLKFEEVFTAMEFVTEPHGAVMTLHGVAGLTSRDSAVVDGSHLRAQRADHPPVAVAGRLAGEPCSSVSSPTTSTRVTWVLDAIALLQRNPHTSH
jgi:hypothetical protein